MNLWRSNQTLQGTILLLMVVCLVAASSHAKPKPRFEVEEIAPPPDHSVVYAAAINNSGVVVGGVGDDSVSTPFVYRNGVIQVLPVANQYAQDINDNGEIVIGKSVIRDGMPIPLNSSTNFPLFFANAINNTGVMAGVLNEGPGPFQQQAAVWSNGVVHFLAPRMQDLWTYATAINDAGVAAGVMYSTSSFPEAFKAVCFRNGEIIPLLPSAAYSMALAINNRGEILCMSAASSDWNEWKTFLVRSDTTIELAPPSGRHTVKGLGLNNLGQVVGHSITDDAEVRAFVYTEGVMHDLVDLVRPNGGWIFSNAYGINDQGQIIGDEVINFSFSRAFLLTPKKFPSANRAAP